MNERGWPLVVRRARPEDTESILGFATSTWHGWDYIPNALPNWLQAADGAFLAATVGEPGGIDAAGAPLQVGQVVAVTRVSMVSPTEAWLEGIRVDPRVRGMGVAADLQIAELHWTDAQDAHVVRYATGASNEASHRLGARDDINLIARFRSWWWSASANPEEDDDEPSAFDADVREQATARRLRAVELLMNAGLAVDRALDDVDALWRQVADDPTFNAGERLYEARSWAMAELTQDLLERHVERGEVFVSRNSDRAGWALAILVGEQLPSEDSALRLSLLVGDGPAAVLMVDTIHQLTGDVLRYRVPTDAPLVAGHEKSFNAAGFYSPGDWEMHVLARDMAREKPIPAADPAHVVLSDTPERLTPPRW